MFHYHFFSFQAKFADLTRVQCQQWPPEVQNRFSRPRSRSWTRLSSCLAWRRNLSRREDQWEASILVTWQFSTNKKPPEVQNRFSRPRDRPSGNRFFSLKPLWSQLRVYTQTRLQQQKERNFSGNLTSVFIFSPTPPERVSAQSTFSICDSKIHTQNYEPPHTTIDS